MNKIIEQKEEQEQENAREEGKEIIKPKTNDIIQKSAKNNNRENKEIICIDTEDNTVDLKKIFFSKIVPPSMEQQKIIYHPQLSHMRILAGAGSGKTETIKNRFLYMISNFNCHPNDFFMVTFTKNSAKHLCNKINIPLKAANLCFDRSQCGTFHALARRVLQRYNILDTVLGKIYNIDELQYHFLNFLKDRELSKHFRQTIRHVFVDEFQDVNEVQYNIIKELGQTSESVIVVGDDNQSIYQFRGSSVKYIHQFANDFPEMVNFCLSTNYRSTPPIVNLANAAIQSNLNQLPKPISVSGVNGILYDEDTFFPQPVLINTYNQFSGVIKICDAIIRMIASKKAYPNQICILSRNTRLLNTARAYLKEKNVLSLLYAGDDDAFSRDYSYAMRNNSITLSTIHSSKGLEWKHVYIVGLHDLYFPSQLELDVESERRLWYVAITRAQFYLTILNSLDAPSRFITELMWSKLFSKHGYNVREFTDAIKDWDENELKNPCCKLKTNKTNGKKDQNYIEDKEGKEVKDKEDKRKIKWFGVVNTIRMLDGQDYINCKHNLLPSSFLDALITPVPPSTMYQLPSKFKNKNKNKDEDENEDSQESENSDENDIPIKTNDNDVKIFPYHGFISQNQIESEFGQYLDLLSRRMVAEYAWKRYQQQANETIKMGTRTETKDAKDIMTLEEIQSLYMDVDAERCATAKGDRIKSVPLKYQEPLKLAYTKYKDPTNNTMDIVDYIYLLSFCNAIVKGKKYILYISVRKFDLMQYKEMYDKMINQIAKLIGNKKVRTAVPIEWSNFNSHDRNDQNDQDDNVDYRGMRGIIDLLIDDSIIIDFKNTLYQSETCRIDFLMQVLTYAALWENREKDNKKSSSLKESSISHVGIYNIIADCVFIVDITNWKKSNNLLNLLINKK